MWNLKIIFRSVTECGHTSKFVWKQMSHFSGKSATLKDLCRKVHSTGPLRTLQSKSPATLKDVHHNFGRWAAIQTTLIWTLQENPQTQLQTGGRCVISDSSLHGQSPWQAPQRMGMSTQNSPNIFWRISGLEPVLPLPGHISSSDAQSTHWIDHIVYMPDPRLLKHTHTVAKGYQMDRGKDTKIFTNSSFRRATPSRISTVPSGLIGFGIALRTLSHSSWTPKA